MNRRFFVMAAPLATPALLSGCASEAVWAPEDAIARAAYRHPGPPALTLFTTRNAGSGNGAHSGLLINASQRVLFDPAGTFGHASLPERNDVIYGMTPRVVDFYIGYHARVSYYVVEQRLAVDAETAEAALRAAMAYGAVPKAQCARAVSAILRGLPGIGAGIGSTWFPENLEADFGTIPDVTRTEHHETDADDRSEAVATIDAGLGE